MAIRIISATIIARSGAILMARLLGWGGTPITQSTLSSISLQAWDLDFSVAVYGPVALSIPAVIFDSLQVPLQWLQAGGDALGYNFLTTVPASGMSMAGKRFRADAKFVPVSGEAFVGQWEANLSPSYIP